jgi:hypothetical protein
MITPNKFITLQQSVLGRLPLVLEQPAAIPIGDLYQELEGTFPDINEFIYALDVLRALGRINVDFDTGIVHHVA